MTKVQMKKEMEQMKKTIEELQEDLQSKYDAMRDVQHLCYSMDRRLAEGLIRKATKKIVSKDPLPF